MAVPSGLVANWDKNTVLLPNPVKSSRHSSRAPSRASEVSMRDTNVATDPSSDGPGFQEGGFELEDDEVEFEGGLEKNTGPTYSVRNWFSSHPLSRDFSDYYYNSLSRKLKTSR
jgi:hypothetical protein